MEVSPEALRAVSRRPPARRVVALTAALTLSASLVLGLSLAASRAQPVSPPRPDGPPYATLAAGSISMLENTFYNGNGQWHMCVPVDLCNTKNSDWGADSLTDDLWLRWRTAKDRTVVPILARLARTAVRWTPSKVGSSDNMMWDAVAEVREYQVTGSKRALTDAKAAMARLNAGPSAGFATGACPAIDYQWPFGHKEGGLKTLETDSNYVKAALLLYQVTRHRAYLRDAEFKYAAIRRYYLSPAAPLYTDFVIDNGTTCQQVPGIFFGSVNGNMIWAGATLAADTSNLGYLHQAIGTALAVRDHLSDSAGIFNPLFTDVDLGEPIVEAMYYLATRFHQQFARKWLLVNASAAAGGMNAQFEPGKFFDGPAPSGAVTSWEVNGGVALMTAAAAVDGTGRPFGADYWKHAVWVRHNVHLTGPSVQIRFTGQAIAITGTIGDVCCQDGFAEVAPDGISTFSNLGIWQNRSSPARRINNQILFVWRWRTDGVHSISIFPGTPNSQQGGAYFHMTGYLVVR